MTFSGAKGYELEEILKAYFIQAGYFVVRGIPYKLGGDDVTDVDLWLYERPAALTRRRLIVDVKNKKSPKVAERLIWTKGLQAALSVDGSIVATTDKRVSGRLLARKLGVTLLDGDAVTKLSQSQQLKRPDQLAALQFDQLVKQIDDARRSTEWRQRLATARSSLLSGLGVHSTNSNLIDGAFFADQAITCHPGSEQANVAIRIFYLVSSFATISLDFASADRGFESQDQRKKSISNSIRFGSAEGVKSLASVQAAISLARQYAENGNATAQQIQHGFFAEADRIPADIVANYISRISGSDSLFHVARELESASHQLHLPSFDELTAETKSLLGVFLDFNDISREKFALAWTHEHRSTSREIGLQETGTGELFKEGGPSEVTPDKAS